MAGPAAPGRAIDRRPASAARSAADPLRPPGSGVSESAPLPRLRSEVPSVCSIWRTADWHEREVYDLSGVNFVGHPDLCRILCPEDWVGHPLRRDYEMPLEYHGIRGR